MKSQIVDSVVRRGGSVLAALALAFVATTSAHAASVPSLTTATSFRFGYGSVAGWSNASSNPNGYNFDFSSISSAVSTGVDDHDPNGNMLKLDSATTDNCSGCSVLGLDSVYNVGAVNSTITGLTGGVTYYVTFNYAGTQQAGYSGASTDFITVSFNGVSAGNTNTVNVASQGFSGWNERSSRSSPPARARHSPSWQPVHRPGPGSGIRPG